jgi:hypothetical protein
MVSVVAMRLSCFHSWFFQNRLMAKMIISSKLPRINTTRHESVEKIMETQKMRWTATSSKVS